MAVQKSNNVEANLLCSRPIFLSYILEGNQIITDSTILKRVSEVLLVENGLADYTGKS